LGKALLAASVRHWGVNRLQAVHGVGHLDGDPTGLIAHRLVTAQNIDPCRQRSPLVGAANLGDGSSAPKRRTMSTL